MSFLTRTITTESDGMAAFAAQQIRQIAASLHGLTDAQIRATPSASALSLAALTRHVLFNCTRGPLAELDPEFELAACERGYDDADRAAAGVLPGAIRPDDTAAGLAAELEERAAWIEANLPGQDLQRRVPVPDRPWFPDDLGSWPLRWVVLRAIEEYARHAGHADIIRESIDGKGAYELNDLADAAVTSAN